MTGVTRIPKRGRNKLPVRRPLARIDFELELALKGFSAAKLDERVGGERDAPLGTGVAWRQMLLGVLQHDAWHGGQIALLAAGGAVTACGRGVPRESNVQLAPRQPILSLVGGVRLVKSGPDVDRDLPAIEGV